MAAFNVGALVQKKTGGIHGVVDSLLEPENDPGLCRMGRRQLSVHPKTNYARPRQTSRSFIKRCHRSDHERNYSNRAQRLGDRRPACRDDRASPGNDSAGP
jgi:hypothetical protein